MDRRILFALALVMSFAIPSPQAFAQNQGFEKKDIQL